MLRSRRRREQSMRLVRLRMLIVSITLVVLCVYALGYFFVPHRLGDLASPSAHHRAEQLGVSLMTVDFDYAWQAALWRPAVFVEDRVRKKTVVRSTTGLWERL